MTVHQKLMKARIALQSKKMKKSGRNAFAKYDYFELADFLPTVQEIFAEIGLCGFVSFTDTTASLTIVDDQGGSIVITSPMAKAELKGCHEVQNLGAAQTYLRRYLWVAAMEIVEHDALDASEPMVQPAQISIENSIAALRKAKTVEEMTQTWSQHIAQFPPGTDAYNALKKVAVQHKQALLGSQA